MTIAHEFHHAIQFGYYANFDGSWWQESTSTWMEEVAIRTSTIISSI